MKRAIQVGLALAAVFLVTAILVSPTDSDDVAGILRRHHSQVSPPIVMRHLHDLTTVLQSSAADFPADLQLLNRFRVRLC
jgi:hypothetical protein